MTAKPKQASRWFPTQSQLSNPSEMERSFRQVLTQLYSLQDQHNNLQAKYNALQAASASAGDPPAGAPASAPPGCGPADTQLLGLRVLPIDSTRLPNGATLKWNAATRNFSFQ